MAEAAKVLKRVPAETLEWLLEPENPAVAVLTRRTLQHLPDTPGTAELWSRRNDYAPVATILDAQLADGSWAPPKRDYAKYGGSLWQIHFLGELMADGDDERIERAAEYAFSRQLPNGSWSTSDAKAYGSIPCLTANVGRALARLGYASDARVARALAFVAASRREDGFPVCSAAMSDFTLNGYCHMLAPKVLLFLAELPRPLWPSGAEELRDGAVGALRDKAIYRSLPQGAREFAQVIAKTPAAQRREVRERYLAEHGPLAYGDRPGWLRFGYPLSYNSDALEALEALAAVGETRRPEYEPAIELVEQAADPQMRWRLRNSFNGKMIADVERKGEPSKWLTLRALQVLEAFAEEPQPA